MRAARPPWRSQVRGGARRGSASCSGCATATFMGRAVCSAAQAKHRRGGARVLELVRSCGVRGLVVPCRGALARGDPPRAALEPVQGMAPRAHDDRGHKTERPHARRSHRRRTSMKTLNPRIARSRCCWPRPAAVGHAQDKKGVTEPELKYQAGASPLADEPMYQSTNPKAPPMTQAEFDLAPQDLLRALRRLPRRAAQGRHRQAADARHHARQGHRLPEGLHRLRLARRHAELADLAARWTRRPST